MFRLSANDNSERQDDVHIRVRRDIGSTDGNLESSRNAVERHGGVGHAGEKFISCMLNHGSHEVLVECARDDGHRLAGTDQTRATSERGG